MLPAAMPSEPFVCAKQSGALRTLLAPQNGKTVDLGEASMPTTTRFILSRSGWVAGKSTLNRDAADHTVAMDGLMELVELLQVVTHGFPAIADFTHCRFLYSYR